MKNNQKPKKAGVSRGVLIIVIVAVLVAATVIFLLQPDNIAQSITVEAGSTTVDPNAFLVEDKGEPVTFVTDLASIDLAVPGEYDVELSYKGDSYKRIIIVRDTVAPVGVVRNMSAYSNQTLAAGDFVLSSQDVTNITVSFKQEPDMTREGSQVVTIVLTDLGGNTTELQAALTIFVDNEAPVLTGVADLQTYIGTEPDYLAGVSVTDDQDLEPSVIVDDSAVDLNTPGTYTVTYTARDEAGNESRQEAKLTVTDDNTPPVIEGAKDLTVYQGGTISYRSGVTVTDDKDPSPTLSIDSSQVDVGKLGTYTVTYTATDATGNSASVEITVTVKEAPIGQASEEVINEMVDKLLAKIVTDDMTDREKVTAIYKHMRANYGYSGHSDKSDWMQGAYAMMKEGQGDCFNYYALAKLMFERLGIPNIDVLKVKNYEGDSSHYWSLVSVDGGATYYHVDCTPRVGTGDDFCLVTDAFLDAYSASHSNCHNRDKSLYPATPTE